MTKNLSPMEHSDNKDLTGHWEELGIPTVVLLLAQPKLGLGMCRYPRNGIPIPVCQTHRNLCHSQEAQEE